MTSTAACATCGSSTSEPRFNAGLSEVIEELRLNGSIAPDEVQRTLSLLEREYQDYSLRISRLQGQIRILTLHQRRVKEYQSNLQTFQSPIRKLPNEILRWIFNYASSSNIFLDDNCDIRRSTVFKEYTPGVIPALALSSVCSQWRNLASSYPEIWSRITLILKLKVPPSGTASKGFMDTVRVFLERSGSFPLSLRIESLQLPGAETNAFHPVLSLVGKHTQRWSAFEFFSQRAISHEMFGISTNVVTFPILENLKIIRSSDVEFFRHAPRLSSLSTNTALSVVLNPAYSWQQITSLELRIARHLSELVRISSRLVSIRIQLPGSPLLPLESELLNMENLRWLMITFDVTNYTTTGSGTDNLEILLSSLLCPALTSLCITKNSSAAEIRWPRNALASFLARSACIITKLLIEDMNLTDDDLISLCKSTPALTSLSVRDSLRTHSSIAITSTFIKSLHSFASSALRPSFQPLLPKLQQLSLTYAGNSFDDAAFVDMVESRCLPKADALRMGITPLRSVVLKYWHRTLSSLDEVKDIYEPLALLDEAGFRIVVNLKDDPSGRSQSVAVWNF
ncbi:hypothetical protein FB446DRAFT_386982 [Lentinula raphanica]|nr:hypothetical protein FB446DRAFT_386982 [Lentinula raphanica]